MTGLELKISGRYTKMKGPGSRFFNRLIEEKVIPVIMDIITDDVHAKAVDYASGIESPEQRVPRQATHPIGRSESGYSSTGKLADSIKIIHKETTKAGKYRSVIATDLERASWTEWGTGIFGKQGQPIVPTKGSLLVYPFQGKTIATPFVLGQPPAAFMRGSMWFLIDNFSPTKTKIEEKIRSIK